MTCFLGWWRRLWRSSIETRPQAADILPDPRPLTTLAELEHVLDGWTRYWAPGERGQPDEKLAAMSLRAESELQTYFGQDALKLVQSEAGHPGKGPLLLAADRLFVTFLGRRAAMAVTRKLNSVGSAINTVPKSVRWLWMALGALLVVGLAAYGHFLLTGSYDLLVAFFRNAGSTFFVSISGAAVYFAYRARSQFDFTEPMYSVWTLVLLSACCRLIGSAFGEVLSAKLPWNPLVLLNVFHLDASTAWRNAGLVMGGPVAMAFLAAGLMCAILLNRRLGMLSRLTVWDRTLIGVIFIFTARELFEIGVIVFVNHARPGVSQVALWFSDPLLTLLLMQAVSIRRSVLNMGHGLVARCWGMMAAGIAFTSAGDVILWAESHGLIPVALSPLGWFIWFFAATAYTIAPCYQIESARLAHEGSYSVAASKASSTR